MKKYKPSVIPNQVSIDDLLEQNRQQQEAAAAAAATATASVSAATGTDGGFFFDEFNNGGYIILPNRNEGLFQTGMPRDITITRKNPKTKLPEMIPVLEIPGTVDPSHLPEKCPCCGGSLNKHGNRPIVVNDIPFGAVRTQWRIDRDRYLCTNPKCNATITPELSFTITGHKVTKSLEVYTRDLLTYGLTLKTVSKMTGLTAQIVKEIDKARLQELYVDEDGKLKPPEEYARYIGVDEFLLHEGFHFATVFTNLDNGHVLFLTEGKTKAGIDKFMDFVGDDWMQHVEAVACDMNADFGRAFTERYDQIKIVYDHFHIVKNYNDHVMTEVRKEEHARLLADGNKEAARELKGARHILTSNQSTLEERDKAGQEGTVASRGSTIFDIPESTHKESNREGRLWTILENNELLCTAYIIKELISEAYKCTDIEKMQEYLIEITLLCRESNNKHLMWFQRLIGRHWDGILNHAIYRISSGKVEGINRKIKTLRWIAYGYPDDEYFFLKIIDSSR